MTHVPLGKAASFLLLTLIAGLTSACSQGSAAVQPDLSLESSAREPIEIQLTFPSFASVEELTSAADTVVRGRLIEERYEPLYPNLPSTDDPAISPQAGMSAEEISQLEPLPTTIYTMQVDDVIAGDAVGSRIEIQQMGGVLDGVDYRLKDAPLNTRSGEEYVLVLAELDSGRFDLPDPNHGAFTVEANDAIETVSGEDGFGVTSIEDLQEAVTSGDPGAN